MSSSERWRRLHQCLIPMDVKSTGVLQGIQLLNAAFDASGNLWFTTGLVRGVPETTPQKATIAGYVTPNGSIQSISILNRMPENGLAINDDMAFLITGPTFAGDPNDSVGFLIALAPHSLGLFLIVALQQ